jgi:glutathione peroxidase
MNFSKMFHLFQRDNKKFFELSCLDIHGKEFSFSTLKGKKILLVNTASECGLTPQYTLLESLFQKYKCHNFIVIGFPSNDFGGQEPLSGKQILDFCSKNYGVTFPIMQKSSVLGTDKNKIFKWLEMECGGQIPTWNFHKFFIDERGFFIKEFEPGSNPLDKSITDLITN